MSVDGSNRWTRWVCGKACTQHPHLAFKEVAFTGERFNRRIPSKRKHVFFALQQATCAVAFGWIYTMAAITVVKLAVSSVNTSSMYFSLSKVRASTNLASAKSRYPSTRIFRFLLQHHSRHQSRFLLHCVQVRSKLLSLFCRSVWFNSPCECPKSLPPSNNKIFIFSPLADNLPITKRFTNATI